MIYSFCRGYLSDQEISTCNFEAQLDPERAGAPHRYTSDVIDIHLPRHHAK